MDSSLIFIAAIVLGLLLVVLALLLMAFQRNPAPPPTARSAAEKTPIPSRSPATQSEKTNAPIVSLPVGLAEVMRPDRSRFAANGSLIQKIAPAAFTEVIAQRSSKHSYASPRQTYVPPQFETGPRPQVPGYRYVSANGKTFGTFTLYKALSLADETPVAIKVVNPTALATAQNFRKKFDQQLAIGYTIRHPNCAAVLGGNANTVAPYVIEEWLPGGSLRQVMTPGQAMTTSDITRIIGQTCNALAYLHKRSIVHQAVSPAHLHFDAHGHLHLIHCAFARLLTSVKRTPMGVVMGDVAYLSGEHMGGYAMTPRSDLYSLGVLAFELATGQTPFKGSDVEVIRQHLDSAPPDPRELNPTLSDDMAMAILKALEKDPAQRFQNSRDMARAFGFEGMFDGFREATNLLYVSPASQTPSPYLSDNALNPYDFSLARRSVSPQASDILKMRNTNTGITVAVNTTHAVVTRELINPHDAMISRTNGQIYLQDGHWWISELPDAPSQNGLYVNESRVTEPRPIHMGDKLRVGKTTLLVVH